MYNYVGIFMIMTEAVVKKWGNSLGVIIPKDVLDKEHIKENDKIKIIVYKENNNLKKSFGLLKGKWTKTGQQIKDESRRELYND